VSIAILLTFHGTVVDLDDLAPFLLRIRRGRPVPDELLTEVRHRYEAIGGSPLNTITARQAKALEAKVGVPVYWAARLWSPEIGEVLASMKAAGITRVVSLPLAPQSVVLYHAAVKEAAAPLGLEIVEVGAYGLSEELLGALVETVVQALSSAPPTADSTDVVLSAHSLPVRVIRAGDLYEKEFREMADAVAARLAPRVRSTRVAFQSQGASSEAWLGPDLAETFKSLREGGSRHVVVAPIGFVADHVETLYDLDVEAKALALAAGFETYRRASAMNDSAAFVEALAVAARGHLT
jgi:protoporphyrin/coproporphyrin ferrochelatase